MKNTCSSCGLCCKLLLINLSEEEYKSGKYKTVFEKEIIIDDFKKVSSCGANILAQKIDGSCIYLDGKLCGIHETRPKVCRKFFCSSKKADFTEMIKFINSKKTSMATPKAI